ncbi:MAG: RNA polymerase sigma factor [Deltaproteobacteria bacterium]
MNTVACWLTNSDPMASESQELARGLRRRDPELLDRLIEQYRFRLFRYLQCLTCQRETAEELFQETWVRVLERGHQYNHKWKFESWLFTIARNLVIDMQRRKRPQLIDLLGGGGHEDKAFELEAKDQPSAFDEVRREEEGERISSALSTLPANYREVLTLRFQEDMTLDEIAVVVRAPLPTVKSRLYRGLEMMRLQLQGAQQ